MITYRVKQKMNTGVGCGETVRTILKAVLKIAFFVWLNKALKDNIHSHTQNFLRTRGIKFEYIPSIVQQKNLSL